MRGLCLQDHDSRSGMAIFTRPISGSGMLLSLFPGVHFYVSWSTLAGMLLGCLFLCFHANGMGQEPSADSTKELVICYNPDVPLSHLEPFSLIVVDYSYPPARVKKLRRQGKTVFGYLSLAKVHRERPYAAKVKSLGIEHTEDPVFSDVVKVNAGDSEWRKLVVGSVVPKIKQSGFNGIFLDDLDDLKSRKIERDGVTLIRAIRSEHPEIKLMANRGLEYLVDFASHVDYVLLESCFVAQGRIRKPADPAWAMGLFRAGKQLNPRLQGVAVDYISGLQSSPLRRQLLTPSQSALIATIRQLHMENDLLSFVSTEDLQSVPQF